MTADAATFIQTAGHPDVAALAGDPRAAIVFDRTGTRVLWANAGGLRCLGLRGATPGPITVTGSTARALEAIAGRLPVSGSRVERVPLPVGIVPVLATCTVRRIEAGDGRALLVVVVDGTGAMRSPQEAASRYAGIVAAVEAMATAGTGAMEIATVAEAETVAAAETVAETETVAEAEPEAAVAETVGTTDEPADAITVTPAPDEPVLADATPTDAAIEDVGAGVPEAEAPAAETDSGLPDGQTETRPEERDIEAEGTPVTAMAPAWTPAAPPAGAPPAPAHGRTIRFVFELDPRAVFSFVSPDLAEAVGPVSADLAGRSWSEIAGGLGIDPRGRVAAALERRDTFTGLTVDWPVDASTLRVPVDLAGMPVFARDRTFRGYRGFGVAKCGAAFDAGGRVAPPAPAEPMTEEEIRAGTVIVEAEVDDAAPVPAVDDDGAEPASIAAPGADTAADAAAAPSVTSEPADLTLAEDIAEAASAPAVDGGFDLPPGAEAALFETLETEEEADLADLARIDGVPDDQVDQPVVDSFPIVDDADDAGLQPDDRAADALIDDHPDLPPGAPVDDLGEDWIPAPEHGDPTPDYHLAEPAEATGDHDTADAEAGAAEAETAPPAEPPGPVSILDAPAVPDAIDEPVAPVDAPEPPDVAWVTPDRPSGEVIPSPIVARPLPAGAQGGDTERGRLSRPEREAFQKIAEALGARMDPADHPAGPASAPSPEPTQAAARAERPFTLDAAMLDRLPVAVAILKDGEPLVVNRAFLDLAGYPDLESLVGAGGLAETFAGSALPRDTSLPAIRRRDGVEVPVHARLHSIPWSGGIASLLVVQETASATGRDRAEVAEARVDELEAILDTATDGVLVLDAQGTVLGANRSAEALFGTHRSGMVGESMLSLLAPESHRAALDYLDGLARNGVASVLNDGREVIGKVAQGGLVPLFMTIGRVSTAKFCAVLRDITQWKRAEEELVNARRSAENASSQKSDFLAKISHEIRTPLNAIIGFSEVMMEERFGPVGSERYKEYLRDIHLSGAHIMSLVNDLLDLSKIEAGKLDLTFEAVAINEVIRECVALMQPQANRDRVIIRTSLSSSLPNVVADSRSLRQIVLNLVSNAIKFNAPGGQVIVSTIYEENGEVAIRVRDTGLGMSADDIGKALEPFRQLHTARPGRGTGLGLPLTKALVEANRAAFRIESAPGQGTLVQVTFPSTRVLAE
jgi:PAS domain S-box-containing protein